MLSHAGVSPDPLSDAELAEIFGPLTDAGGVGLAVSGGADSTALMVLFARWRKNHRPDLPTLVLSVDHGLRPEAAGEVRAVASQAASLGLDHLALVWSGPKPQSNLQAEARRVRYRLMFDALRERGFSHLATGHHMEDQAETMLMRLGRGSGLFGLAGMAKSRTRDGLELVRPFLEVAKARLIASLRAEAQDWREDPSNLDLRFTRVRLRQLMPALAVEGLTAERLTRTAKALARSAQAIDQWADSFLASNARFHAPGPHRLDREAFAELPEAVGLRLLERLVRFHGETEYPPRSAKLEAIWSELTAGRGDAQVKRTLNRTVVETAGPAVWIYPEAGRLPDPGQLAVAPGEIEIGAHGVLVVDADVPGDLTLHRLGAEGRALIKEELHLPHTHRMPHSYQMPRAATAALACVWHGDRPVFVPGLDWWAEGWRELLCFRPAGTAK